MCGITAVFLAPAADASPVATDVARAALRAHLLEASARQRHRGPDWSGVHVADGALLAHERLAIVGVHGGAQPLLSADGMVALCVNGEIYNHRALEATLGPDEEAPRSGSDCEVLIPLWRRLGAGLVRALNGIFAFALWDAARGRGLIARDPLGVCPLYWGHDADGHLWVASELKAIAPFCADAALFPPGHVFDTGVGVLERYWLPTWRRVEAVEGVAPAPGALKAGLLEAVRGQLMGDVPYGVLLSGGLDSSLVAWCAQQHAARRVDEDGRAPAWWPRLHSFAIGLPGSPDLAAAAVAAEAIGTQHHGFTYTLEEGIDALPEVIRHIETYDVTTIRASTPMFLLARRIRAMGIKMVLSGEGADEVFGGYLYFHKAPDAREFHAECVRKLDGLHQFDCLRANKAMMAWGVEARVPFLDLRFLDVAMGMDAAHKRVRPRPGAAPGARAVEKAVLREAFEGCLPDAILWRQKEQFSDGVGYGWIDGLKARAEREVSDAAFAEAAARFPLNTPASKEAYWYRTLFERHFPGPACAATVPGGKSIACSSPAAIAWDAAFAAAADPSGRAVAGVHVAALG